MMSAFSGSDIPASVPDPPDPPADAHRVAQALAQDAQAVRFKKLLIYRCAGIWETQPDRLEAVQFADLLHQMGALAPTWQDLQTCLIQSASQLNKSAEYTLVAHRLLALLQPLYPDAARQPAIDPRCYEAIAQQLTADPDLLRLKKLLILACTSQWESDRQKLIQTEVLPLIQQLHSLTITQAGLDFLLNNLVKTLSKPSEYRLLAARLLQAFQLLYADAYPDAYPDAGTALEPPAVEATRTNVETATRSAATKFSTIAEATAALSALLDEHSKRSPVVPAVQNWLTVPADPLQRSQRLSLRQAVMQSSNPLRTKILLFSLLHEPFQLQHESLLKDHNLDDLLQMMMQSYPQPADLKAALHHSASRLPDAQAYLPSVDALLQAVQQWGTDSLRSADRGEETIAAPAATAQITAASESTRHFANANQPPAC